MCSARRIHIHLHIAQRVYLKHIDVLFGTICVEAMVVYDIHIGTFAPHREHKTRARGDTEKCTTRDEIWRAERATMSTKLFFIVRFHYVYGMISRTRLLLREWALRASFALWSLDALLVYMCVFLKAFYNVKYI